MVEPKQENLSPVLTKAEKVRKESRNVAWVNVFVVIFLIISAVYFYLKIGTRFTEFSASIMDVCEADKTTVNFALEYINAQMTAIDGFMIIAFGISLVNAILLFMHVKILRVLIEKIKKLNG